MRGVFVDHPFWTGFAVTVALLIGLTLIPAGTSVREVRLVGLIVYGAAIAVLGRAGLDLSWFFLGGCVALVVSFPLLMSGAS